MSLAHSVFLAIVPPHQCAVLAPLKQWGYVYFSRSRLTELPPGCMTSNELPRKPNRTQTGILGL